MIVPELPRYKFIYYNIMLNLYKVVGSSTDIIMANSSWTANHCRNLWGGNSNIEIVYPPCNTTAFSVIPLPNPKKNRIVSFSQFRPEKDQISQIRAFYELHKEHSELQAEFYMIGGCRHEEDIKLLKSLQKEAEDLGIAKHVFFKTNLPQEEVIHIMSEAKVAIHTMKNEHFGISIVEMMAAGLITIAHASGGPYHDIIKEGANRGYLAKTIKEYSDSIYTAISSYDSRMQTGLRENARDVAKKNFSDEAFMDNFEKYFSKVFHN
mmetsp:Transcript_979/g.855  ORF Transcript_979/g.855 Transcript_979/m.855 type:complete len:265 (+) Transcript_979:597-1391(+)